MSSQAAFTATDIRISFECQRLFVFAHCLKIKAMFYPPSGTSGIGWDFHMLARRLFLELQGNDAYADLFQNDHDELDRVEIAKEIIRKIGHDLVDPWESSRKIQKVMRKAGGIKRIEAVKMAFSSLIRYIVAMIIENRLYCEPQDVVRKTITHGGTPVERPMILPNGETVTIQGEFDGIIQSFMRERPMVVEYKTYQSFDPSGLMAQAAAYALILNYHTKKPVDVVLATVFPEWERKVYSFEIIEQNVLPVLNRQLTRMLSWKEWRPGQPNPPDGPLNKEVCQYCHQKKWCFFILPPA